jgi:AcrR family transcriptional regulator
MRADARRNREQIVATALDLFAEHGPTVSMEEIAATAGLGVGTLYRHFPDRQALLEEIAADSLRRLLTAAQETAGLPGWDALVRVVEHCAGLPLALTKSLDQAPLRHPELPGLMHDLNALFEKLAGQALAEGTIRPDVTPANVVELLSVAVCRPGARPDDPLTTVILDGLRSR